MDRSTEAAVRARAHQLWVESGYADGYQDQHWRRAEREVAARIASQADGGDDASARSPEPRVAPGLHSDGMSMHPSVLDPGPRR